MRNIIEPSFVAENESLIYWFLSVNFPESGGYDDDLSLGEFITDNYETDPDTVSEFIDEDGCCGVTNTMLLTTDDGRSIYLEFRPDETVWFIDDDELGATGEQYAIRRISFRRFEEMTAFWEPVDRLFLLPMVGVEEEEADDFAEMLGELLGLCCIEPGHIDIAAQYILRNCLETDE